MRQPGDEFEIEHEGHLLRLRVDDIAPIQQVRPSLKMLGVIRDGQAEVLTLVSATPVPQPAPAAQESK